MRKVLPVFVTIIFMSSCTRHDDRAIRALKSLQTVEAATKIGVSKDEYSRLIADANTLVQEFLRDKENRADSEAKSHLQLAVGYYAAAKEFWDKGIQGGIKISDDYVQKVLRPLWNNGEEEIRKAEQLLK